MLSLFGVVRRSFSNSPTPTGRSTGIPAVMESCRRKDPSSSANSEQVVVSHWDWDVVVDFKKKTLRCTATLEISTLCEGVGSLVSECNAKQMPGK